MFANERASPGSRPSSGAFRSATCRARSCSKPSPFMHRQVLIDAPAEADRAAAGAAPARPMRGDRTLLDAVPFRANTSMPSRDLRSVRGPGSRGAPSSPAARAWGSAKAALGTGPRMSADSSLPLRAAPWHDRRGMSADSSPTRACRGGPTSGQCPPNQDDGARMSAHSSPNAGRPARQPAGMSRIETTSARISADSSPPLRASGRPPAGMSADSSPTCRASGTRRRACPPIQVRHPASSTTAGGLMSADSSPTRRSSGTTAGRHVGRLKIRRTWSRGEARLDSADIEPRRGAT